MARRFQSSCWLRRQYNNCLLIFYIKNTYHKENHILVITRGGRKWVLCVVNHKSNIVKNHLTALFIKKSVMSKWLPIHRWILKTGIQKYTVASFVVLRRHAPWYNNLRKAKIIRRQYIKSNLLQDKQKYHRQCQIYMLHDYKRLVSL